MINYQLIKEMEHGQYIAVILAGGFGGLAVTRELGRYGVPTIVMGEQDYITKSKYCLGIHAHGSEEIVNFLTELPKHVTKKPVLLTDSERYLELLYKNWNLVKNHYFTPVQLQNQSLINKVHLYQAAKDVGLKVPAIYKDTSAITDYPVIVKPLNGLAHLNSNIKKAYECFTSNEVLKTLQLIRQYDTDILIQQIIPGHMQDLYSVTLYRNARGEIHIGYVMRKIRQFPADYGTGTTHITCKKPKIVDYSKRLLDSVNYVGVAEIEYKYCEQTKDFFIIEVNGRFPLHTSMIHKLGNGFVYRIYLDLVSSPVKSAVSAESNEKEVVWSYFLKDLLTMKPRRSLLSYYFYHLRNSRIQGAIWDWSDLKPLLYFYKDLIYRLLDLARHSESARNQKRLEKNQF